jgi:hypothetical protein
MAACHDDVAALKRPPEIANAQAQHGTDHGGDGAAVQFTPGLVLEPQLSPFPAEAGQDSLPQVLETSAPQSRRCSLQPIKVSAAQRTLEENLPYT